MVPSPAQLEKDISTMSKALHLLELSKCEIVIPSMHLPGYFTITMRILGFEAMGD
jgi:hypothetical protein